MSEPMDTGQAPQPPPLGDQAGEQNQVSPNGQLLQAEVVQPALQAPQAPTEEPVLPPLPADVEKYETFEDQQPPLPPLPPEDEEPPNHDQSIVVRSTPPLPPSEPSSSSESESEEEEEELAGPIHPHSCIATGPGVSGGPAGASLRVSLQARDANGRRVREGGAYVKVEVRPSSGTVNASISSKDVEHAELVDAGDGTYTGSYTAPAKGNYQITVHVNGQQIGDSPFPVYFSAPDTSADAATTAAATTTVGTAGGVSVTDAAAPSPSAISAPVQQPSLTAFPNMAANYRLSLGFQAAQVGVQFPPVDEEILQKTVLVGGISPFATQEALQSVFGLCGGIRSINFTGPSRAYAFVEFTSDTAARSACSMTGVALLGQSIRVENAVEAKTAAAAVGTDTAANPFQSLHAQQLQAYQLMQQQQSALAQQVVAMRAAKRGDIVGSTAPLIATNGNGSGGMNAANAQAEALARKFGGGSDVRDGRDRHRDRNGGRHRDYKRTRSRSRSSRRHRDDHRRHRSRSRDRYRSGGSDRRDRDRRSRKRSRSGSRSRDRRSSRDDKSRRRSRSRDGRDKHRDDGSKREKERSPRPSKDYGSVHKKDQGGKDELEELFNELEG